jgi:hypothetical protein
VRRAAETLACSSVGDLYWRVVFVTKCVAPAIVFAAILAIVTVAGCGGCGEGGDEAAAPVNHIRSQYEEYRKLPPLEDYKASLRVHQDIAAGRCPDGLVESMGDLGYSCLVGNADFEPDPEVAIAVFGGSPEGLAHLILVLKPAPDAAEVVFEKLVPRGWPLDAITSGFIKSFYQPVIAVGDLNANGFGEFVYATGSCGMNTCYHFVHVVEGWPEGYVDLSPGALPSSGENGHRGISMSNSRPTVEDVDGDGLSEIAVTGGTIGSAGGGPRRERTETYGWDGSKYVLESLIWETTDLLYHHIVDAERLIYDEDYYGALAKYLAIRANSDLVAAGRENEEQELRAWVDYRIALLMLRADVAYEEVRSYLDSAVSAHGRGLHSSLAHAFREVLDDGASVQEACRAVDDYVDAHHQELLRLWSYGWLNPSFAPRRVCPSWVWQDRETPNSAGDAPPSSQKDPDESVSAVPSAGTSEGGKGVRGL